MGNLNEKNSRVSAFMPPHADAEQAEPAHKVKDYDFRKPKKFTREHLRDLNTVNENITRIFASNLSGMLRVFSEVNLSKLEERRYIEYINDLPDKTLIGLVELDPEGHKLDPTTMILHVPSTINFFLIDILLGGSGEGFNLQRGYTEIETEILKYFYGKLTSYMEEAWNSLLEATCRTTAFETNPRIAQVFPPDDTVIVMTFEVKIRNITDFISVCISAMHLDAILNVSANSNKYGKNTQRQDANKEKLRRDVIYESLSGTDLELKAILGSVQLDTQDVVNLQVSDVIPLNRKIDSDIFVTVDDVPWFTAKLGEQRIKKAVKICDILPAAESKRIQH